MNLLRVRTCEKIGRGQPHVIPAKAGIQKFQQVTKPLDPGFHRGDEQDSILSHVLTGCALRVVNMKPETWNVEQGRKGFNLFAKRQVRAWSKSRSEGRG
jgi:hypothetical protein